MNKLLRLTLPILLIVSTVSNASDPNAIRLLKGNLAPFNGVELSDSYIQEVYKELNDANKYKLLNDSLQKSIDLYQANEKIYSEEISELKVQNTNLDVALGKANTNSFWVKALWFVAGIVVTGAVVHFAK